MGPLKPKSWEAALFEMLQWIGGGVFSSLGSQYSGFLFVRKTTAERLEGDRLESLC